MRFRRYTLILEGAASAAFSVSPRAHFTLREAEMFSEVGMEQDLDGFHVV